MVLTTLAMVVSLAACSDDGEKREAGPSGSAGTTAQEVQTNARLGKVRGPISKKKAERAATEVTAVVERWLDEAYGGDYPRSDFGTAFRGFTKDAAALAEKQPAIMSNTKVGSKVEGVEFARRVVRVDLAGPRGKAAGATARFRATIQLAGLDRADEIAGRLMLTPAKGGWKVFGFDVRREEGVK